MRFKKFLYIFSFNKTDIDYGLSQLNLLKSYIVNPCSYIAFLLPYIYCAKTYLATSFISRPRAWSCVKMVFWLAS